MNVFYNQEGLGDTLLVTFREINTSKRKLETKGDIVRLLDIDSGETAGFHIFNVSKYGTVTGTGMLAVTEDLIDVINQALKANDWETQLNLPEESPFVVGYVQSVEAHPDADKLRVCQVDVGPDTEQLQIVCGAKNVQEGLRVVVAREGAFMPSGMEIRVSKLRGVPSNGMICSIKELAIPEKQEMPGILSLDEGYQVGEDFLKQYHSE
ncbi:tRNA-binding protein [Geomicrobium halophilum]|uniref:tRNA-binding protein n=1 Tax=Geomicrobium halophilum TaxID=549000 RepID=A0A841PLM6_9BACL|nr:DUF4479 family protein [Geomicrobium halophilum]MBB6448116.1 tRNA-binding protein [Geomicrobium halophilum]